MPTVSTNKERLAIFVSGSYRARRSSSSFSAVIAWIAPASWPFSRATLICPATVSRRFRSWTVGRI